MHKLILIICIPGLVGAMERPQPSWPKQSKRSSSDDEKPHFLTRKVRQKLSSDSSETLNSISPLPVAPIQEPIRAGMPQANDEVIVEEVVLSFNCKYWGIGGCNRQFTDREAEWRHIYRFHGIIAAKYEEYNSIACDLRMVGNNDDENPQ